MGRKKTSTEIVNGIQYYFQYVELPRDANGKRVRKKIRAKSVDELNKKVYDFIELKKLGKKDTSNQYLSTFMHKWLFEVKFLNLKASSKEKYLGIYNKYIKDSSFGKEKLENLNAIKVQQFYSSLNVSDSLIRNIHKLIKPCLQYAFANSLILKDYTPVIQLPPKQERSITRLEVFTIEEQKAFLLAIKGHKLESLFYTLLTTGIRLGECLALEWNNYDGKILYIDKSVRRVLDIDTGKYVIDVTVPKTKGSVRSINLGNKTISMLNAHKKEQNLLKMQLRNQYNDNNLIFCSDTGNYLDASNVRKQFKKILKDNNIREIKLHGLRHSFATRLFENNVPTKTISNILGHSDINITLEIYTHILDKTKEETTSVIDNIF